MNHLNEEQFIDILMEEPHDKALDEHLAQCDPCRDQMTTLEKGLSGAQMSKPRMPLMAIPTLTYGKYAKHRKTTRYTLLAAAAMLLLSVLGFRMEMSGDKGLVVQFAIFGQVEESAASEARIAELEDQLTLVLDNVSSIVQGQMNAFYNERDEEVGDFQDVLYKSMVTHELEYEKKMIDLKDDFHGQMRKLEVRRKMQ